MMNTPEMVFEALFAIKFLATDRANALVTPLVQSPFVMCYVVMTPGKNKKSIHTF